MMKNRRILSGIILTMMLMCAMIPSFAGAENPVEEPLMITSFTSTVANDASGNPASITFFGTITNKTIPEDAAPTFSNIVVNVVEFGGTNADPVFDPELTTLAAGETTNFTSTYTLSQADIDAGSINIKLTLGCDDLAASSLTTEETVSITQNPALSLALKAVPVAVTGSGQKIEYTATITNTGNVTLDMPSSVTFESFTGTATAPSFIIAPAAGTTLAPGQSVTATAEYTVALTDIALGKIEAVATTSTTFLEAPVAATSSTATTLAENASVSVTLSANPTNVTAVGQTITYTLSVTNTGGVALSNVVGEFSNAFSGTNPKPVITLPQAFAAGEAVARTVSYTVTAADMAAGSIKATYEVAGATPNGAAVDAASSEVVVTTNENAALTATLTASPVSVSAKGQIITYTLLITNTGAVPLTNFTGSFTTFTGTSLVRPAMTPIPTTLAPGASATLTGVYTVAETDLAIPAGTIDAQYTLNAKTPTGKDIAPVVSTVAKVPAKELGVLTVKLSTTNTAAITAVGQTITYTVLITNTGTLDVSNLTADLSTFTGTGTKPVIKLSATTIAAGRTVSATFTYTVTDKDMIAGFVSAVCTVKGTASNATTTSADSEAVRTTCTLVYTTQTLKHEATGITVTGGFAAGAVLSVTSKDALHAKGTCTACDKIRDHKGTDGIVTLATLDISATLHDGKAVKVTIPIGTQYNGDTIMVMHCNKGVLEEREVVCSNGSVTADFSSLSPFYVFEGEEEITVIDPDTDGDIDAPQTGDNTSVFMLIAMLVLLAGIVIAWFTKEKFRRNRA